MIPATAAGGPPPSTLGRRDAVLLGTVLLAVIFGFRQSLLTMVRMWEVNPMYSYGFAVPLISVYLVWSRRGAFKGLPARPSYGLGAAALLLTASLAVSGRAAGIQVVEQLAFVVALVAAVLMLLGLEYLRRGWMALAYLLFMVPLWDGLTERLHVPFQMRSAEIGVGVLQFLGVPAHREGITIALPGLTLEVARACSGVNYLIAVIALGVPLAYLHLHGVWRRAVLLVSAVLVAALSNGLRVALIGVLAYFDIGSPLHGPFHMLHGLFVAGVGYVALFAGLKLLASAGRREEAPPAPSSAPRRTATVSLASASVVAVFSVLLGADVFARTPQPVPLGGGLDQMPLRLGAWTRAERDPDPGPAPADLSAWTGADVMVTRRYRRDDGQRVDVFVGYFASQQQARELVNHRAGELHARAVPVRVSSRRVGSFDANFVKRTVRNGDLLFWYEMQSAPHGSRYAVKARTLWGALVRGENSGAVVALSSADPGDGLGEEAVREFAGLIEESLAARLSARGTKSGNR